jgi:hypothetical protein
LRGCKTVGDTTGETFAAQGVIWLVLEVFLQIYRGFTPICMQDKSGPCYVKIHLGTKEIVGSDTPSLRISMRLSFASSEVQVVSSIGTPAA